MPRIKRTTVYKYDELSEEAQAKARDWFRDISSGDNYFAESVTEDFKEVAKACGLELCGRNRNNKNDNGGPYWSGFSSQGDGAAFTANWSARNVNIDAMLKDRPATYKGNAELAAILQGFAALAASEPTGYGSTCASFHGHTQVDTSYDHEDDDADSSLMYDDNQETLQELCSDLAHWFYRCLEREYEYMNSDENVAETIRVNEYEFTEEGRYAR